VPVQLASSSITLSVATQNPVNVTGSVSITGTPNVNVVNTPSINVANTPNVHVTGPVPLPVSVSGQAHIIVDNGSASQTIPV